MSLVLVCKNNVTSINKRGRNKLINQTTCDVFNESIFRGTEFNYTHAHFVWRLQYGDGMLVQSVEVMVDVVAS